jgi:predicted nuclease of predicted toxin-antitoxin system
VRLLLNHNLSGRGIGAPLRASGHDVRALQEEAEAEGMDDPDVLALATAETRIVVTRNSRDFAPLAREWAELGRPHAGIILIWSFDHSEFSSIVSGVERYLSAYPGQERWRNLVVGV